MNGSNQQTASGAASKTLTVAHGETVTFTATPVSTAAERWEVESWTGITVSPPTNTAATLSNVTSARTVTVKFKKVSVTINGSDSNAWKKLKDAVADASGPDVILISGIITAPAANQQIKVTRTVTVKGTNAGTDKLDANSQCFIFDVWSSGNLTLDVHRREMVSLLA